MFCAVCGCEVPKPQVWKWTIQHLQMTLTVNLVGTLFTWLKICHLTTICTNYQTVNIAQLPGMEWYAFSYCMLLYAFVCFLDFLFLLNGGGNHWPFIIYSPSWHSRCVRLSVFYSEKKILQTSVLWYVYCTFCMRKSYTSEMKWGWIVYILS